jgi:putative ABC transport system ATP-binding protein
VDLVVHQGETLSLMGPSGSGKTSLLNLAGFLDKPDSGRIYFAGLDVTEAGEDKLQKLRLSGIGFIFQSFNLVPTLSALENVALPMELSKKNPAIVSARARELLVWVGMNGKENRRPAQLSSGENQRVAIARALANDPILIVADEPTGNLDSKNSEIVMNLLKRLNVEKGIAEIIVTHNPVIASLAQRRFKMQDGKLTEEAPYPFNASASAIPLSGEIVL